VLKLYSLGLNKNDEQFEAFISHNILYFMGVEVYFSKDHIIYLYDNERYVNPNEQILNFTFDYCPCYMVEPMYILYYQ
jgi:hypothetical protein